jgi:eukaryotic-like serine/threonine-protein kinase
LSALPESTLKKLGKYEVLGELGRGAMGVVYRARDPIINRLVALKTITTGVADDPAMLERFYREAQSAGGLQHPNIVTIYDMGQAGELPYIAMELVEGENLEQVIARRSVLPITLKLVYAMQACRAFDFAHKRGIVHRDIKPGNVMVSKDGTVKVVDFGIARVLETSRTQTGMLIGTFAYMSPEQYHGEHADERSDIWSFGVLVYELLSNQKPFTGPTPATLMHNICNEEPAPLRKLLPECPEELELTVSRMLRKSPSERYESMDGVLLDLDLICKTLQSQSIAELLEQSRRLLDQGNFAEARDLVRQALQFESGNQQARALLEKADAGLKRIRNRPKAQQLVEKGHALLGEGRLQEAKVAAENAVQLDSSFAPAEDLRRAVQAELDRARTIAEWLDAARQYLAEGLPDHAEGLLAKVLEKEPLNAQAKNLQQQVLKEKNEREERRRLLAGMQQARELWTHQDYGDCTKLLQDLQREFPEEEEISRLLQTVREDQREQQKQQGSLQSRNLLAAGRHTEAIRLLSDLQKLFPDDEEIPGLLEYVRKDQLNQRRSLGLAEARSLLAAGRYDACVSLLTSLRKTFPDEAEIPQLLEIVHQIQAEQLRQRGIAEAGKLLDVRQYKECLAYLEALEKQFPRDDEILILQRAVREQQSEQEKQQLLERELDALKTLMEEKRYPEVIGRTKKLLTDFPSEPDFLRLAEFAASRQANIEKELLLKKTLEQAKTFFSAARFEEAIRALQDGLKVFPGNSELLALYQESEVQQRKLQVRKQIEQRVREIRVKINRAELSDAIGLAKETLVTLGPDTDVTNLLNSAEVELQARERNRIRERMLETIRTQMESGDLDAANQTIDEALQSNTLDSFDPRVQRLSEQIRDAKTKCVARPAPSPSSTGPGLSKEYAFLQAAPLASTPLSPEKTPPLDSLAAPTLVGSAADAPYVAPSKPEGRASGSTEEIIAEPLSQAAATEITQAVVSPSAPAPAKPEERVPPSPEELIPEPLLQTPAIETQPAAVSASVPVFQIEAKESPSSVVLPATTKTRPSARLVILAMVTLAILFAVFIGLRSTSLKPQPKSQPGDATENQQPSQPRVIPQEEQQRQLQAQNDLLVKAQKDLAQGDFQSARRDANLLKQNGGNPADLTAKINQVEWNELKQSENQFDQLKTRDNTAAIPQLKALQQKFQALAADGGPQSSEAQTYANKIPGAIAEIQARVGKKSGTGSKDKDVQLRCDALTERRELGEALNETERAYLKEKCQ